MNPTTIELIGAILFAVALIHTFSTKFFEHLAHTRPAHSGIWHFLGEVEVVFGLWALVLTVAILSIDGKQAATTYLEQQSFTEPMFVFAIMVIRCSACSACRWRTRSGPKPSASLIAGTM